MGRCRALVGAARARGLRPARRARDGHRLLDGTRLPLRVVGVGGAADRSCRRRHAGRGRRGDADGIRDPHGAGDRLRDRLTGARHPRRRRVRRRARRLARAGAGYRSSRAASLRSAPARRTCPSPRAGHATRPAFASGRAPRARAARSRTHGRSGRAARAARRASPEPRLERRDRQNRPSAVS